VTSHGPGTRDDPMLWQPGWQVWYRADTFADLRKLPQFRQPGSMKFSRRQARLPQALPSERGFLELAGRDDGIPLRNVFICFRDLVSADMDWADSRK
jgi:hypothetical protein